MQPFQYDLRSSAAKDNSITHAAAAPSNLDAATTMRSAETELQNTIELRATASEIAAPKPGISTPKRQKDDFEALFKRNFKRKIISAKIEKICWQITFAALMQPFQYDLRSSAAKDNSITHAAAAPSNLDAATTMRSAETELQNTIELRAMASEIAAPKPDGSRRQSDKKTILKHFLKGILKGKLLAPKLRKSADKSLSQPWCSHSNTIYDLQLQKTIVLRMQPLHQATLTQPLQCDLRDWVAKHNRTTCNGVGNCSSKTGSRRQSDKKTKRNFKRKITSAKIATIFWQITVAAWMRPLQYDLQSAAAKDNTITHAAAARSNLDAAPFQCNLQPEIQEPHGTTHTDTTTHCKTHRRNNSRTKRPQPHPSHKRGTFHRRLQPLYTEKHKVWCSGFLPKT